MPPKTNDAGFPRLTASGLPVVDGGVTPSGLLTRFRIADYEAPTTAPATSTPRRRRIAAARLVLVRTTPKR